MNEADRLLLCGALSGGEIALGARDLAAFPPAAQVPDVSALVPGRKGRAVRLDALLARAKPAKDAAWVNAGSRDPSFAVSLPLAELAGRALVVYELDGAPLPAEKGGPFRLLVPGHADECVHVKGLARLELARERGRDTRPLDDAEHRALHQQALHRRERR